MNDAIFEHRFWLQIMGDHARFIMTSLSPKEKADIAKAEQFIQRFDRLLSEAGRSDAEARLNTLNTEALGTVMEFRTFKLNLLAGLLTGKVELLLTPSYVNHMVNELEEYLRILSALQEGKQVPLFHPLHYDLLWLQDAYGHAASIASDLDFTEKQWMDKSLAFQKDFEDLYLKAVEMAGYVRANLKDYPAFRKFHTDINLEMRVFMHFLMELEEMELREEILDRISPLIPDHMFREECYYLTKLAMTGMVPPPECDPGKPRVKA